MVPSREKIKGVEGRAGIAAGGVPGAIDGPALLCPVSKKVGLAKVILDKESPMGIIKKVKHGEGQHAGGKVLPDCFAKEAGLPLQIEEIINQLKCHPDIQPVEGQGLGLGRRSSPEKGSGPTAGGEEAGGFLLNPFEVGG